MLSHSGSVRPAVEARLQAAKRLRRTGLLADKRGRVLRAARATYLELECERPSHFLMPLANTTMHTLLVATTCSAWAWGHVYHCCKTSPGVISLVFACQQQLIVQTTPLFPALVPLCPPFVR